MTGRAQRTAVCLALAGGLLPAVTVPAAAQGDPPPLPNSGPNCIQAPTVTYEGTPWGQQLLAPERIWDITEGNGLKVAVVDTGVDARAPQLAGKVLPGADVMGGSANGPADDDCFGHGTFVAGIIGASPAEGTGFTGVAPGVQIVPIRVATGTEEQTGSTFTPAALARGIRAAVDSGAQVINVSASSNAPDPQLTDAVRYAAERDVSLIASAANGAQKGDPVTYPASYPGVIAVGAIDSAGNHAAFSQTGPYLSLVAPGVDVVSTGPHGPGHWQGSGTSYAAPFVAGTAALVRAYHPELNAAQVKQRLEMTASHPATALPDPALGWGTVNPTAAVSSVVNGEGGAGRTVVPPSPKPASARLEDDLGPRLALFGAGAAVVVILTLVLVFRLGAAGNRRGWSPARVVRVRPDRSGIEPDAEQQPVSTPGG